MALDLSLGLTERDLQLLDFVHQLRGATTRQLHACFWGEETPASACYRRISKLIDSGYLNSRRLPSSTGVGSGKRFLMLGVNGAKVVAMRRRMSVSEISKRDPSSWFFVNHHEAIGDFRIALNAALERMKSVALREWVPEAELRKSPVRIPDVFKFKAIERSRVITLVPDAAFTLATLGMAQRYMLEVDMATISLSRLQVRIRGYLRLQFDEVSPVLFVAPTPERVAQILSMATEQAEDLQAYSEFFFCTHVEALRAANILTSAVWRQVEANEPVTLLGQELSSLGLAS